MFSVTRFLNSLLASVCNGTRCIWKYDEPFWKSQRLMFVFVSQQSH